MGLFGDDEAQDARLDELERQMRSMAERIGTLSTDLSYTRMELMKTRIAVSDAVSKSDLDPAFGQLNEQLAEARRQLEASATAADESWSALRAGSDDAVEALRSGVNEAWERLEREES